MQPTIVPRHLVKDVTKIRQWGAPPGVSDEEVGTIEGLAGETLMGGRVVQTIKCYWKPRPAELALLMKGMPIEVEFITQILMPHLLTVVQEDDNAIRPTEPADSGDN